MPAGGATEARGTRSAVGRTAPPVSAFWTAPSAPEPVTRTSSASSRPSGPGESRTTGRVSGTIVWRAGLRRRRDGQGPNAGRPALRRARPAGETYGRSVERLLDRRRTSGLLRVGHPTRRQPLPAVAPSAGVV